MTITGIDHIQLAMPTGREAEARRFYSDILGLTEVKKPQSLAARGGCWFEGANTVVHLGVQADFVPTRKGHPAFRVADIAAFRRALEAAEVPVQPDETLPGVRRFHAVDPFGNRLEFIQDGDRVSAPPTTEAYYAHLTPYYKLIYADWDASVQRQAALLDGIIRQFVGPAARTLLDAACGIGTQSIGLAQLGYTVTASDLSEAEVAQARREAVSRDLGIEFGVADMRDLWSVYQRPFDIVIACDNAVPHLPSEADILLAFEQFYRCLRPGGGCLMSVRDYARMERGGTRFNPRIVRPDGRGRTVLFDVWDFAGDYYDLTTYVVEDNGHVQANATVIRGGRYYCVTIDTLEMLLRQVGFSEVQTLRNRFFQPLIIGLK